MITSRRRHVNVNWRITTQWRRRRLDENNDGIIYYISYISSSFYFEKDKFNPQTTFKFLSQKMQYELNWISLSSLRRTVSVSWCPRKNQPFSFEDSVLILWNDDNPFWKCCCRLFDIKAYVVDRARRCKTSDFNHIVDRQIKDKTNMIFDSNGDFYTWPDMII